MRQWGGGSGGGGGAQTKWERDAPDAMGPAGGVRLERHKGWEWLTDVAGGGHVEDDGERGLEGGESGRHWWDWCLVGYGEGGMDSSLGNGAGSGTYISIPAPVIHPTIPSPILIKQPHLIRGSCPSAILRGSITYSNPTHHI